MAQLLLHSLGEFSDLLVECLDVVDPELVVEVGTEEGTFAEELVQWARKANAKVVAVDPAPSPAFLHEAENHTDVLRVVREKSLDALPELRSAQVYFLDGDHNYGTVLAELTTIDPGDRVDPYLVVLHDVGWPSGRRDQYYDPTSLPAEWLHEYTYDEGVVVDNTGTVVGGFRGEGQFAVARTEGGPRNGVLTAVEDFLDGRDDLTFVQVPCIFGLGFVWSSSAPYADALGRLLAPYDRNPLLERLERNRLELYLRVLDLQDNAVAFYDRERDLVRELDDLGHRMRDVTAENRALWRRVHEAEEQAAAAAGQRAAVQATARDAAVMLDEVVRSRAFRLAELLSKARATISDTPGISSDRVREAVRRLHDAG